MPSHQGRIRLHAPVLDDDAVVEIHAFLEELMTRFESRPARSGLWEYLFFVDVEGHESDANVAKAIDAMRDKATFVKVLGSYPIGSE